MYLWGVAEVSAVVISLLLGALFPRLRLWGLPLFYGASLLTIGLTSLPDSTLMSFALRWSIGCTVGLILYSRQRSFYLLTVLPLTVAFAVYAINILLATHPERFSLGPAQLGRPLLATGLVYLLSYGYERQINRFEPSFILSLGAAASIMLMGTILRNLTSFATCNMGMLVALIPYLAAITYTLLRRNSPSRMSPIMA